MENTRNAIAIISLGASNLGASSAGEASEVRPDCISRATWQLYLVQDFIQVFLMENIYSPFPPL